ncbi:MAG: DUF2125 domain-containing protein [Pseudomonadota bacterium]
MRRLVWLLGIVALLGTAWWFGVSTALSQGITGWFEARRAEGWQAELAGPDRKGFPARVGLALRDVALADPATGLAIGLDRLDIYAPTLWPADPRVDLPATPITVATPQGRGALTMAEGTLALDTYPGTALGLAGLGWTSGAWSVEGPEGGLLRATGLTLTMDHVEGATYDLRLAAPGFAPGDALRRPLRVPEDWPVQFEALTGAARITFDVPWDRRALEARRPQPRVIKISAADAVWGELSLRLAADLTVDAAGVPTGSVNLRAENWPIMLDLAEASGLLDPRLRVQAQQGLNQLARLTGDPDSLDVQLNLAQGLIAVGFIPIGPAPRLVIR